MHLAHPAIINNLKIMVCLIKLLFRATVLQASISNILRSHNNRHPLHFLHSNKPLALLVCLNFSVSLNHSLRHSSSIIPDKDLLNFRVAHHSSQTDRLNL